jgi:anti-sigma-K factor RskA
MSEIHDLAAFYVVGALDRAERARYEAHLEGCEVCHDELRRLSSGVETLARSVAEPAPQKLRERVYSQIESTVAAERSASVVPLRRRWHVWLGAAAAVVVVVIGVATGNRAGDPVDRILAAEDLVSVDVDAVSAGTATFRYSDDLDQGVFSSSQFASVAEGETYELWLIGPQGPQPAGLFTPDADGEVEFVVIGPIDPGTTLGLTIEPAGGSDQPTGDVLAAVEL